MQPLFTFGDLVLDVVASSESTLDRDTDTPGQVRSAPGGSAANFAVWSRRLGAPVCFASRVGEDLLGRALIADLEEEGVEALIQRDPVHPTAVLVLFTEGEERHMVVPRGAHHYLSAEDLPEAQIRSAGWLHVTGYSYFWPETRQGAAKAIALAREAGVPISFDPSSAGFIRRHGLTLPQGISVLIPNREEVLTLTGAEEVEEGALALAKQVGLVAVKLGPDGALLAQDGQLTRIPPVQPPGPVVDGTGAGDAWGAALIHGLRRGLEPVEAAGRANWLGAQVVTQVGARPKLSLAGLL